MLKFKVGQKVLWIHKDVEDKGPYKATITEILEKPSAFPYRLKFDDNAFTPLVYEFELKEIEQENLMVTTFQELKVDDEFTDETGIKYRKAYISKYDTSRQNAIVLEHPILGGKYIEINPGQKVNKIVKLTKLGDMNVGDVFITYVNENKYYFMKLKGLRSFDLGDNSFNYPNGIGGFDGEFEVVGHINLVWPQ